MAVTAGTLEAALRSIPGAISGPRPWTFKQLADGANEALAQSGIKTREGAAVFIAQCLVESAYFRTTREYQGSKGRYAPYYGRGFIQVTWQANYAAFGKWCRQRGLVPSDNYFLAPNEDRLAADRWAWLGAVWYFTTHRNGLVELANKGDNVRVGRAINRGNAHSSYAAYGEDHRQKAYRALLAAGITAPSAAPPVGALGVTVRDYTRDDVRRLQRVLGVKPADGLWGPDTDRQAQAIRRTLKSGEKRSKWDLARYWRVRLSRPLRKQSSKSMREGIQWALKVKTDGIWGPATDAAYLGMRKQHKMK